VETERALLAETVEFSLRATEDLMEGHMPEPAVRRESNEDDDAALASIPATFCDAFTCHHGKATSVCPSANFWATSFTTAWPL